MCTAEEITPLKEGCHRIFLLDINGRKDRREEVDIAPNISGALGKVVYHWDDLRHNAFETSVSLRLAAIAGSESFSYLITESDGSPSVAKAYETEHKFHFFDKPLGYLKDIVGDNDLLYADFDKVQVAVRGVPFVAMSPSEADDATIVKRLHEVTDMTPSDEIFTDITDENIVVVFALPQVFAREVHAWFSNAAIIHIMSALMMTALRHSRGTTQPVMLVNSGHGLSEIILCKEGALMFANHFKTAGPEDVLYFILAALQNLQITPEDISVKCCGPMAQSCLPVLQTYLAQTSFFMFSDRFPRSDYPGSETADLISISKCAS